MDAPRASAVREAAGKAVTEPTEAPAEDREAVRERPERTENTPTAALGIGRLLGNPVLQVTLSILLAIFCLLFLPKALDVVILIAIVALMLFKVF